MLFKRKRKNPPYIDLALHLFQVAKLGVTMLDNKKMPISLRKKYEVLIFNTLFVSRLYYQRPIPGLDIPEILNGYLFLAANEYGIKLFSTDLQSFIYERLKFYDEEIKKTFDGSPENGMGNFKNLFIDFYGGDPNEPIPFLLNINFLGSMRRIVEFLNRSAVQILDRHISTYYNSYEEDMNAKKTALDAAKEVAVDRLNEKVSGKKYFYYQTKERDGIAYFKRREGRDETSKQITKEHYDLATANNKT